MRALILHGPGDLRLESHEIPRPGTGEVVIRTEWAMTCTTDAKILRSGGHPALGPMPTPFGHEVTGVVATVGPGVSGPREGAEVVVANSAPCGRCRSCARGREELCENLTYLWGSYAEYVVIPAPIVERNMLERPASLPSRRAPLVEPVACAINAVSRSQAGPDDDVVVLGGGFHGLLLTACLAARGCSVTVCDPHEERRSRALQFGASAVREAPRDPDAVAEVRRHLAGGRGADIVFEAVGRPEAWQAAIAVAGRGAEVTLYGGCPPGSVVEFPTGPVHYDELRIQGSYHHTPDAVRSALDLLATTPAFDTLVGEPIDLADVADVLDGGGDKRPVDPTGRSQRPTPS